VNYIKDIQILILLLSDSQSALTSINHTAPEYNCTLLLQEEIDNATHLPTLDYLPGHACLEHNIVDDHAKEVAFNSQCTYHNLEMSSEIEAYILNKIIEDKIRNEFQGWEKKLHN